MTILSLVSSPIFTSDKKKLRLSFNAFYWRVFRRPSWSSCNSSFFFTSHKRTTYNAMQRLGENTSCLWSWECSADRLHSWQLNVWGKHLLPLELRWSRGNFTEPRSSKSRLSTSKDTQHKKERWPFRNWNQFLLCFRVKCTKQKCKI